MTLLELGADPSVQTALKDYTTLDANDRDDRAHRARVRSGGGRSRPKRQCRP